MRPKAGPGALRAPRVSNARDGETSHDPTCPVQGQTAMEDQEAQMHSELKVTWPRWFQSGSKSVPRLLNGRGLTLSSCVGQIHSQGTGNGRRLATAKVRSPKRLATPLRSPDHVGCRESAVRL